MAIELKSGAGTVSLAAVEKPDGLGVEVRGYDFDRPPDQSACSWLRQALVEHHLLLFRGRSLDPARQCLFSLVFGGELQTCSPQNRFVPAFPQIARVSNRQGHGHLNIGTYWHSDGAYLAEPTAVSLHHIIVPTADGDTLYVDLAAAYDRLSAAEKERVSRMSTRAQTGVVHPLVRRHPVTGRLGLYVNLGGGTAIVDEQGREDGSMAAFISAHLGRNGTFYRHKWQAGDLVVVDNFAVAHHATAADPSSLRVLHRTSIHGPAAWWRNAGPAQRRVPWPTPPRAAEPAPAFPAAVK